MRGAKLWRHDFDTSSPRRCTKDFGLVVIEGKQHYLGRYGSAEFVAEYNRLIQKWLARRPLPRGESDPGDPGACLGTLVRLMT